MCEEVCGHCLSQVLLKKMRAEIGEKLPTWVCYNVLNMLALLILHDPVTIVLADVFIGPIRCQVRFIFFAFLIFMSLVF